MSEPPDWAKQDLDVGGHEPGQLGMVVRRHPTSGQRHLDRLSWGLLPHGTRNPTGSPRPAYARAETVATLPFFKDAFASRRALVPADVLTQLGTVGKAAGKRFAISRKDKQPMAWAGLWEGYRDPDGVVIRTYCVITVEAVGAMAEIHHRMPLMLEQEDWPLWLGESSGDPEQLLQPKLSDLLVCRPVKGRS